MTCRASFIDVASIMIPGPAQRFILAMHYSTHRRLFKPSFFGTLFNRSIITVIAPFFGIPSNTYFLHHLVMHHVDNNAWNKAGQHLRIFQGTSNGGRQFLRNRRSNRHIVPLNSKSYRLFTPGRKFAHRRPPFDIPWKTAKTGPRAFSEESGNEWPGHGRMRRMCTGPLVHCEQTLREQVSGQGGECGECVRVRRQQSAAGVRWRAVS